ncbi:hypothetical protein Tco_0911780, partial [Tanacetum coccineum]
MTNPITINATDSQMHNNIMAAGSRDRPPMLATGRYAQWQSRFMRYVDTKPNGEALGKCILQGPYKLSNIIIPGQLATDESPKVPERTVIKTFSNISPENKAHYDAEKEVIHFLLTGIGDEIYSTVDACKTAHNMWIAIEKLQQGESLNKQDVETSLFWEFGRFTSRDGESIESYYSRFYKMMNEIVRNQSKVATIQVNVQFLQQLQPEWSRFVTLVKHTQELDTIARNANPLALVAAAQQYPNTYYQAPKPHKSYANPSKQSSSTRFHVATSQKDKAIAKPITPPSESASKEDSNPEQAQKDKEMQRNLALIGNYFKKLYKPTNNNLRTSSNSRHMNVDTTLRYVNEIRLKFRHFAKECRKPKRVKDYTYHKEKMLLCKQAEKGVPLQAEHADWLEDMDEEVDEQELEAHYNSWKRFKRQHSEQPESINDIYVMEKVDSNVIPDSLDMCDNDNQADQNAKECDDERVVLANLIANLKLDTDENK